MNNKTGWLANTLIGAFMGTTALTSSAEPLTDLQINDIALNNHTFENATNDQHPATPLFTIQITPSVKLATNNQDIINSLHEQLEHVDNDYAIINGINVPDFIRRPTFFSEVMTGTPHGIQINIMSGESNFKETNNPDGSAKGFGQFMRNTSIENALKYSQNRKDDPIITNIQGLFPQNIRIAYSKYHDKHLDRLTIIDPNKLKDLTVEQ